MFINFLDEYFEIKLGICIYFYLNVGMLIKIFCIKLLIKIKIKKIGIKFKFFVI